MLKIISMLLLLTSAVIAADVNLPPAVKEAPKAMTFPPGTKLMPARKVKLGIDKEHYAEIDFPARPAVVDDLVNLLPGEKILVEADVKGSHLVNLHVVDVAAHPERTLELEFKQNEDRDNAFMILVVKNPFGRPLHYAAGIQDHGKQGFRKTDVVDVGPGLVNFESWHEPLTRVLLNRFELVDSQEGK
jgi:hypothetical protein